jgi:hypothetical protein
MLPLALQSPLALVNTVREPSLDALHKRVDHRRLHLVAQLPACLDRRVELVLNVVVGHGLIVTRSRRPRLLGHPSDGEQC